MAPITVVVRLVRDRQRLLIVAEQGIEDAGPAHPALGPDAWVQMTKNPDIPQQFFVVRGTGFVLRDHVAQQIELLQLRQHVLNRAIHDVVRIHQGAMPVEQNDLGAGGAMRVIRFCGS